MTVLQGTISRLSGPKFIIPYHSVNRQVDDGLEIEKRSLQRILWENHRRSMAGFKCHVMVAIHRYRENGDAGAIDRIFKKARPLFAIARENRIPL